MQVDGNQDLADSQEDDVVGGDGTAAALVVAAATMDSVGDPFEEKRLKRMRRNRESAAQSRNRKKQYVEELEEQVRTLEQTVGQLTNENFELKQEHSRITCAPPPVMPPSFTEPRVAAESHDSASTSDATEVKAELSSMPSSSSTVATNMPVNRTASTDAALLGILSLSRTASSAADVIEQQIERAGVLTGVPSSSLTHSASGFETDAGQKEAPAAQVKW